MSVRVADALPAFFKVKCGTGVKNQTEAFCPYCRASGKPSDFTTKEQVRYARQIVEAQAHEGVERMMKEALVGDAVGTTLEFKSPGTFEPITDMIGGHPFRLKPGEWTDDTSMALCLAASLIEWGRFDERDQMQRYVKWWREGYMSSNGICFDIGNTTAQALAAFQRTGDPFFGSTDPKMAGNGS